MGRLPDHALPVWEVLMSSELELLSATNPAKSWFLKVAREGAEGVAWVVLKLGDQWTPSEVAEKRMLTESLLATKATQRAFSVWRTAREGAA